MADEALEASLSPSINPSPSLSGELVSMTPAITRMLSRGATPEAVAALLGVDAASVRRMSITISRSPLTDDELIDNMRNLMTIGYQRALEVMQFGPQAEQAALTRLLIGYALKSISGESTSEFEEIRGSFEGMLERMRYTPNKDFTSGIGITASDFDLTDSDEGFDG